MNDLTRQELGGILGYIAGAAVVAALLYLLSSFAARGRIWRTIVWFWAWAIGGCAWATINVAVAGAHQVHRQDGTGAWIDVRWDARMFLIFAGVLGVLGAMVSLYRPRLGARTRLDHQAEKL